VTLTQKIFGFEGRLRRRDYWLIGIVSNLVIMLVSLIGWAIFGQESTASTVIQYMLYVPSFWIGIATALKRCHDRDKGGGWVAFFWLVPIVGWIWGAVELGFLDGTQGRNSYGKSPKGIGSEDPLAEVFA